MNPIEKQIREAKHPVALTGAGISAPSGIPTFQGNWKGRPIREFLTRSYFKRHPLEFFELYMEMVGWCQKPVNAAHLKLAEWGIPVITQNIDGLHTRAGSKHIVEMHGTLSKVCCRHCGKTMDSMAFVEKIRPAYEAGDREMMKEAIRCDCGAIFDTDVVLYDDRVRGLDEAWQLTDSCDLMLVVGTSLSTYPAALLPEEARKHGAKIIVVNEDCIRYLTEE